VINEEMHNQKNYNIYTFESQDEKSKRFKSIVVTQLISFSYNMLSFNINKEKVKDVIQNFIKYFEIEETKGEEIVKNLEEYSCITENKVKLDITFKISDDDSGFTNNLNSSSNNENNPDPKDNLSIISTSCKVSSHLENDNDESDENDKEK
jgi:hypothetical protein